jgi:hypothetical protein
MKLLETQRRSQPYSLTDWHSIQSITAPIPYSFKSDTRHTSRSALASFLRSRLMAFCARSKRVAPSTMRCLLGLTTPVASSSGTTVDCKYSLKKGSYVVSGEAGC